MSLFDYLTYQWTKGQRDWHVPYNNALEALKDFLGDKGSHASLGTGLAIAESEITAARDGEASLLAKKQAQDALFNIEHNSNGSHQTPVNVAADWKNSGSAVVYLSPNSFTIPADVASIYVNGRRLKMTLTGGNVYATVATASYSTPNTTVTLNKSVLDNTLSSIAYSVISPGTTGAMPVDPQEEINTSNIIRALEEIQENHGGSMSMEAGWSDSFGNANEQGAEEVNSTGFQHDPNNTLYKGTDPQTGASSDHNYGTESNFLQQEWTNSNQVTSQATVASGTTVTLSSGVWPTNCAKGRISFDGGTNWFDINSRDSNTQLTLDISASDGAYDYIIRMSEFDSGAAQLNLIPGSSLHLDITTGGGGSLTGRLVGDQEGGQIKNGQSFTTTTSDILDSVVFKIKRVGSPTDNYFCEIYTTDGSGVPNGSVLATSDNFDVSSLSTSHTEVVFRFSGSNRITLSNSTRYAALLARTGSLNSANCIDMETYSYYPSNAPYWSNGSSIFYRQGAFYANTTYQSMIRVYYELKTGVTSEYVSICKPEAQNTVTAAWTDINSASITETLNSQNAYYWLGFNPATGFGNGTEISIFNANDSVWRKIVRNSGGSWEYNNDVTNSSAEAWVSASTNDLLHAVSQALSAQSGNRMTGSNLAAISDSQWEETGGWSTSVNSLFRGITLNSNNTNQSPSVSQYRLNYDSERGALDLRSKSFDPGFVPSEAYLWTRAEHSDADGPGIFYISRNGGSEWTAVTMDQKGLPLTGDIRILRGTVDLSGQTSGQDFRCRYQTEQNKDQFIHSWGLQAKS